MKLGDTLKEGRESKELTVQAVSDAIHLSVKQINALEANNFNLLPEPVTTRGFIRSYAKFLEIDSAPLLSNYRELVPHQDPNTIVLPNQVNEVISTEQQSPWLLYIIGAILLLFFLVIYVYYIDDVADWSVESEDTIAVAPVEVPEKEAEPVKPVASVQTAPVLASTTDVAATSEQQPASTDASAVAAPSTVAATQKQVLDDVAETTPVTISEPLVLRLKEDCWVSIKSLSGKVYIEQLLPAGTEQGFDVQLPFRLKIGNASAATASYRGQPLDLLRYAKHNVTRMQVTDQLLSAAKASDSDSAVSTAAVQSKPINEQQALVIKTTEACWVSVKNLSGQKLFEQLVQPGDKQVIAVVKPFRLTIGNASAAQARYWNQALDLESNVQSNVAKLIVE